MDKKTALNSIESLISKLIELRSLSGGDPLYCRWRDETEAVTLGIFGEQNALYIELHKYLFPRYVPPIGWNESNIDYKKQYLRGLDIFESKLVAMKKSVEMWPDDVAVKDNAVERVITILSRFHRFAQQLNHRHDNREAFVIKDEYDVQDLVHALLKLHFDDVRAEDPAPICAGASSRIDFVLKEESIGVEIKKTREGLKDRELGTQLITDKERYKSHHNCKYLVFFIYDPDGYITNPTGLIKDLESQSDEMKTYVVINSPIA